MTCPLALAAAVFAVLSHAPGARGAPTEPQLPASEVQTVDVEPPAGPQAPAQGFEAPLDGALETIRRDVQGRGIGQRPHPLPPAASPQLMTPTFRVISWNVQAFGKGMKEKRTAAYQSLLEHMFSDSRSAKILAIQEVSNEETAEKFDDMLPGRDSRWTPSFEDTADPMDNAFFTRQDVQVDCQRNLFTGTGSRGKSWHPARLAHMRVGDFDFYIVSLHLTFERGNSAGSSRELHHILDWVRDRLSRPNDDPDIILAGDFNLPTEKGKTESDRSGESRWRALEDIIADYPMLRREYGRDGKRKPKGTELVPLVDDLTSRSHGEPANNYDHFMVTGDVFDEEFIQGSAAVVPPKFIHAVEGQRHVRVSDHYPISAGFRTTGPGADGNPIRPDGPGRCE